LRYFLFRPAASGIQYVVSSNGTWTVRGLLRGRDRWPEENGSRPDIPKQDNGCRIQRSLIFNHNSRNEGLVG
jgi:hypothetical protein